MAAIFLLIPLSWMVMIDYITKLPFLTPMFLIAWGIFLWKDPMKFRDRCDWAFDKSVDFLLYLKKIGCIENKLILYKDEEGRVSVNTRFADEDVWHSTAVG